MRHRFVPQIGIFLLLLSACSLQPGDTPLPNSDTVLRSAAVAAQELESAEYTLDVSYSSTEKEDESVDISAELTGSLYNAGNQQQVTAKVEGVTVQEDTTAEYAAQIDILLAGVQELYFRIDEFSVEGDAPLPLFSPGVLEAISGQWWLLPSQSQDSIAPDPRLMRAQTEVVTVTNDFGVLSLDDHEVRHLGVMVDKQKFLLFLQEIAREDGKQFSLHEQEELINLLTFEGELWIDTTTHVLHKNKWLIRKSENDQEILRLEIDGVFTNHNQGSPIAPPESFKEFTPLALIGNPSGFSNIQVDPRIQLEETDSKTLQEQEQLLKQVLSGAISDTLPST